MIDETDRKIISDLRDNARMSLTDLAGRIGLTVAPTHRRLRRLEEEGVITGYRTLVDPGALGLGFEAALFLTLNHDNLETIEAFERAVTRLPHVLQAQRLFGNPGYLLRVRTEDLESYNRFIDRYIATLPGIDRITSTLVAKNLVMRPAHGLFMERDEDAPRPAADLSLIHI